MNDSISPVRLNAQIIEEASAWFVEFHEGEVSETGRDAFTCWLKASPAHVRAYLRVSAMYDRADWLSHSRTGDAQEFVSRALADVNVVRLPAVGPAVSTQSVRGQDSSAQVSRRGPRYPVAVAASVLLLALAGAGAWQLWLRGVYSTGIGEQRSVTLVDGSAIQLNARSRVRIRFSDDERSVDLLEGQALFQVAKDSQRPFVVRSDSTRVRAIGTQFDVDRRKLGTVVTVVEGRVAVLSPVLHSQGLARTSAAAPPAASGPPEPTNQASAHASAAILDTPLYLSAGEQVVLPVQAAPRLTQTDVTKATAWTQRKLVFVESPLSEVVEEYNRYHEMLLVIRDPRLESFKISGVFSASDPESLVVFLRAQPNIEVQRQEGRVVLRGR